MFYLKNKYVFEITLLKVNKRGVFAVQDDFHFKIDICLIKR